MVDAHWKAKQRKPTAKSILLHCLNQGNLDRPTYQKRTGIRRRVATGIAANANSALGQVTQCSRKTRSSKYHITGRLISAAVTTPGAYWRRPEGRGHVINHVQQHSKHKTGHHIGSDRLLAGANAPILDTVRYDRH